MKQTSEFLKLSEVDRSVLFWLIDRVKSKAIKSWITYIEEEYKRKSITISADLLFEEALALHEKQFVDVNE